MSLSSLLDYYLALDWIYQVLIGYFNIAFDNWYLPKIDKDSITCIAYYNLDRDCSKLFRDCRNSTRVTI